MKTNLRFILLLFLLISFPPLNASTCPKVLTIQQWSRAQIKKLLAMSPRERFFIPVDYKKELGISWNYYSYTCQGLQNPWLQEDLEWIWDLAFSPTISVSHGSQGFQGDQASGSLMIHFDPSAEHKPTEHEINIISKLNKSEQLWIEKLFIDANAGSSWRDLCSDDESNNVCAELLFKHGVPSQCRGPCD